MAFVVDKDGQRVVRWAQVRADDAQLLDEERVVGELEIIRAVRLWVKVLEGELHAALGDRRLGSHGPHTPVLDTASRLGVHRSLDQPRDAFVDDPTLANTDDDCVRDQRSVVR